jgi:hypothetical protein
MENWFFVHHVSKKILDDVLQFCDPKQETKNVQYKSRRFVRYNFLKKH